MKTRVAFKSDDWEKISFDTTEVKVITDHPLPNGVMDKVVFITRETKIPGCKKVYQNTVLFSVDEFRQMYRAVEHWIGELENDGDAL